MYHSICFTSSLNTIEMRFITLSFATLSLLVEVSHQLVLSEGKEGGYPIEPAAESSRFDPYSNVTPLSKNSSSTTANTVHSSTTLIEPLSSSTSKGVAPSNNVFVLDYWIIFLIL